MSDFQWGDLHIDWFSRTFANRRTELSRRAVEKLYKPRKGEPRKGKSKGGEKTITPQDFGNLMRLMVVNGKARATYSYSGSSKYRIRMVSEDYSYVSDLFDQEIFTYPSMRSPMPWPDDLTGIYTPNANIDWDNYNIAIWKLCYWRGIAHKIAFGAYNYRGGDFDFVFDKIAEFTPFVFDDEKSKEIFIFDTAIFIAIYKAFKIGKDELMDEAIRNPPQTIARNDPACRYKLDFTSSHQGNYNVHFIGAFRSDLILDFLAEIDRRDWVTHVSPETFYKAHRKLIRLVETKQPIPPSLMKTLQGGEYSEETEYRILGAAGATSTTVLSKSQKPEILKAINEIEQAISNKENFKLTCNLAKKKVGKVRIEPSS
jgi:hypothetical protein